MQALIRQTYERQRERTELVQQQWRNGATSHIVDVVWLYRLPLPVAREGDLSKVLL
jgi:hypothetical protein